MKALLIFMLSAAAAFAQSNITGSLNFRWDPNTEPDLAGYRFHSFERITNPDGSTGIVGIGKDDLPGVNTTFTKTGLLPNKSYQFYVTAYNEGRLESEPSNVVQVDTPVAAATAPANLTAAVDYGFNTATISWLPNPAEQEIIAYEVSLDRLPSGEKLTVRTTDTSVVIPIEAGAYYTVSVTAIGPINRATATTMILGKLNAPKRLIFEGKVTWEFE